MNERVEFKTSGRHFVAIWQPVRSVWDVYAMRDGYVTRVFLAGQSSIREAKGAVRNRLMRSS